MADQPTPGTPARPRRRALGPPAAAAFTAALAIASTALIVPGEARLRLTFLHAAGAPTTATTAGETPTTDAPTTTEPATADTTSAPNTTAPAKARPGSTTTTVCRNSYDPACGPFRWDPDPGPNAPIALRTTVSPEHPKPGDTVTVTVVADDPDASLQDAVSFAWDGDPPPANGRPIDRCPERKRPYGPWTPPPKPAQPGHVELTFTRTLTQDGPAGWAVTVYSALCDQWAAGHFVGEFNGEVWYNPYASTAEARGSFTSFTNSQANP